MLSLTQAVPCGVSAATVHRRVRAGEWQRLHPRVFLVGGHRLTDEAPGARGLVVGRRRTGDDHRRRRPRTGTGCSSVRRPSSRSPWRGASVAAPRPGVLLRRRDLLLPDLVGVRDLWLADTPLAALETAIALPDGSTFLDRALQRARPLPRALPGLLPQPGLARLVAAGRMITAAADRADPRRERLLVRLLRDARDHRLDARLPVRRVPDRPGVPGGPSWPSRSTGGRGMSTPRGSATTGARATRSPGPAGTCSASPGTTSTVGPPRWSPRSSRR